MIITRKPQALALLTPCLEAYRAKGTLACIKMVDEQLLNAKIKFPLLEYCAQQLQEELQPKDIIPFCDGIASYDAIGGHVLLGILLQNRLANNFEESLSKAKAYIGQTSSWHACDTIGERVWGVALLRHTEPMTLAIHDLAKNSNQWVVRSIGAGIHYAIKKGLPVENVIPLFELLLSMADTRNKEIKQGVGWAAKTTAKFHPEIIHRFEDQIAMDRVGKWFRTKIKIGLARHAYAKRN